MMMVYCSLQFLNDRKLNMVVQLERAANIIWLLNYIHTWGIPQYLPLLFYPTLSVR